MSDYDYDRWVLNSEYRNTVSMYNNADRRMRQANRAVNHQRARLSNANANISRAQNEVFRDFSRKLEKESDKLSGELTHLNQELHKEIYEMRRRFDSKIDEVAEMVDVVAERVDAMDEKVADISQMVSDSINSIAVRIDSQKSRAAFFVRELNTYISYILTLNPDKLAPEKFSLITDAYNDAMSDIENEDYEASISRSQEGISLSVQLSSELEILNERYDRLIEEIEEITEGIADKISVLSNPEKCTCDVMLGNGESIQFDGQVSYWSSGIFDAVVDDYEQKVGYIRDEYKAKMDIEGLEQIKPEIEIVDSRLDSSKDIAMREYGVAYNVQMTIQALHQVLVQNDILTLVESGFVDGDPRKPYSLKYEDGNLYEVTVIVFFGRYSEDKKDKDTKNNDKIQIVINVSNPSQDDKELCRVMFESIVSRLKDENIEVANYNSQNQGMRSDAFTKQTVGQGNKNKEDRVLRERQSMNLQ